MKAWIKILRNPNGTWYFSGTTDLAKLGRIQYVEVEDYLGSKYVNVVQTPVSGITSGFYSMEKSNHPCWRILSPLELLAMQADYVPLD